jgi:YtkA-like protein
MPRARAHGIATNWLRPRRRNQPKHVFGDTGSLTMTWRHSGGWRMPSPEWRLTFLACAGAVLLSLAGCHRSTGVSASVFVQSEITPRPVQVGPANVAVSLADSSGKPLVGARVTLEGNMTHPGMSPVFADAKELGGGRYQGQLNFSMGGDWVVLVHITSADGHKFERQLPAISVGTS